MKDVNRLVISPKSREINDYFDCVSLNTLIVMCKIILFHLARKAK